MGDPFFYLIFHFLMRLSFVWHKRGFGWDCSNFVKPKKCVAVTVRSTLVLYYSTLERIPHKASCFIRANAMQLATRILHFGYLSVIPILSRLAQWPRHRATIILNLTMMDHTNPIHQITGPSNSSFSKTKKWDKENKILFYYQQAT